MGPDALSAIEFRSTKWILSINHADENEDDSYDEQNMDKPAQYMKTQKTYEP